MDNILFENTCEYIINNNISTSGIGTLSEKTIHSVFKHYYEPNVENHEIKIHNFIADIVRDNEIIEIQTGQFNKLRRKIETYIPDYNLTIIYPITITNSIHWINPATGEIQKPRKSPKRGSIYSVFPELYKIKSSLNNPSISIRLPLINSDEYRYLDGWSKDKKKGATKCDKIPTKLIDEILINNMDDYKVFIPDELKDVFSSKDFSKKAKISLKLSQSTLNILNYLEVVKRVGKSGNSYLYKQT